MLKYLILLLTCISFTYGSLLLKTKLGDIIGRERTSRDGKIYKAFTGIPYAKPPLGNLRFKNPVKAEPWIGTLNGTEPLKRCLQIPSFIPKLRKTPLGQEDCLYLSVYTPDINPNEKLAVLIYVHGGGFRCGDVGPEDGPDYFMDENVILVNFHYRLAALGFLSTENSILPGNFGLKDQAMAVKWVYDNIESFGGDPKRITVFGESAGGTSTHFLGMSPLTKDLIKSVISESGTVNKFWGFSRPGAAKRLADEVIEKVGCNGKSDNDLLECLQKVDALRLILVELDFLFWDFDPAVVFRPVQEPDTEGAFMPFDPLHTETKMPWITGVVSHEGLLKVVSLEIQDSYVTQQFIDKLDDFLPQMVFLNNSCPKVRQSMDLVKKRYFPSLTIKLAQKGVGDIYSDAFFMYPMAEAIQRHRGPLYQYYFDYKSGNSLIDKWSDKRFNTVGHADELLLLFNWKEVYPKVKSTDDKISRQLVKMWANFAKKQNPTPDGDINWPEGRTTKEYLHITDKFKVKKNLGKDVVDYWSNLPLYKSESSNVKSEL